MPTTRTVLLYGTGTAATIALDLLSYSTRTRSTGTAVDTRKFLDHSSTVPPGTVDLLRTSRRFGLQAASLFAGEQWSLLSLSRVTNEAGHARRKPS